MACEACAFLGDLLVTYVVIFDDLVQALLDKMTDIIDFYQSFDNLYQTQAALEI